MQRFLDIAGGGALEGVRLNRAEALGYLGYAGQELDAALEERVERAACACERDLRVSYVFATFLIEEASAGGLRLAGCGLELPGADLAAHVAGAQALTLMACTLGAASEREMARARALSATDGLLYSTCCSALVEAGANAVEALIVEAAAERGLHTTEWRFSPGYGDLPLSVQPAFVRALDATRRIGLSVAPSHLMVPMKSVTAVVGLFAETPAAGGRPGCSLCQIQDSCVLRAAGRCCHD